MHSASVSTIWTMPWSRQRQAVVRDAERRMAQHGDQQAARVEVQPAEEEPVHGYEQSEIPGSRPRPGIAGRAPDPRCSDQECGPGCGHSPPDVR